MGLSRLDRFSGYVYAIWMLCGSLYNLYKVGGFYCVCGEYMGAYLC